MYCIGVEAAAAIRSNQFASLHTLSKLWVIFLYLECPLAKNLIEVLMLTIFHDVSVHRLHVLTVRGSRKELKVLHLCAY